MENKLQTLVILSPGFPANEADSTCMPPQQIFVKALKEVCPGLNVVVISFHYPFHSKEYQWNGVQVIPIGGKDKGQALRVTTWIKALSILKKLNKQHQLIGILSFWFGECSFIGDYFSKHNKLTHYSWLLGQDAKKGNKYFKWIKPRADSLIALSDFIAAEVKKNYKITPANVIPVGIDTSLFKEPPQKKDIDVLGAGSLIPLKQYDVFIEAISHLKEFIPDIKAVICGTGPDMQKLQLLAAALNLENNLLFAGELPHHEVLIMMQRSKTLLHPSNYEGFGSVLSEALYAGAHVVSFTRPMIKNFRHHHIVKNKDEMNAELLSILKDKKSEHDAVLMYPIQQTAKNMVSLFVE